MESLNAACVVPDTGFLLYLTYCTKNWGGTVISVMLTRRSHGLYGINLAGEIFRLR